MAEALDFADGWRGTPRRRSNNWRTCWHASPVRAQVPRPSRRGLTGRCGL